MKYFLKRISLKPSVTFSVVFLSDSLISRQVEHLLELLSGEEGVGVEEVVTSDRPEHHNLTLSSLNKRHFKCFQDHQLFLRG